MNKLWPYHGEQDVKRTGKKKLSGIDKYIIFCISFAVIFTIVEEVRMWLTGGMEASALTAGVFAMCTGELFACVLVYRFKIKKEEQS